MQRSLQIFQLLRLGSGLLTGVLLAKTGLGTAEIGLYEQLLYIGSTVVLLGVQGLLQAALPLYHQLPPDSQPALSGLLFVIFSGIAAAVIGIFGLGQAFIVPALTGVSTLPYFSLYCLFVFFQVCATPVEQVYLLRQQPQRLLWWGIASFVVPPVALLIPLWAGWGFGVALVGLTGSAAARFGWALTVAWPCWRAPVPPGLWASYRRLALPLLVGSLVGNLIVLFDPWLVGRYFADAGTFALYRYGTRELPLALALATALGTALTPRLSADLPAGLAELKRSTRRLFHWVFPPAIVLLFLTKPLFPVVFNPDFADSAPLFNIYLLLTISRVLLPNAVVLAKQKAHILLIVSVAELVLKIVLGYWFIQWWGLSGLAWSAVLAFWFEKIALIVYLEFKTDLRTRDWLDLRWYTSYVLVLLAAYMWVYWRG